MLCPVCKNLDLVMTDRQGIEIDSCPACRGVWLDRGELDKIIERTVQTESHGMTAAARVTNGAIARDWPRSAYPEHHDHHRREEHGVDHQRHHRSFWKELFD